MEIMVFGAGYVGLVTGAGLASSGNHVILADLLKDRIEGLRRGECPIYEPGLPELLKKAVRSENISYVHLEEPQFQKDLEAAEIYFLAVGTPEGPDGRARLDYLLAAADRISNQPGDLKDRIVVVKSTVPVSTGDLLEKRFAEKKKFPVVVSNPEFLKQGSAVLDFLKPERVVVGTEDEVARKKLAFLYKPFMMKRDRIVFMKRRSAELVKYACNTFLAMKISFINEMSQVCEKIGADVREVREGMITDSRIGEQFLFPGIGYGGSCFPKDIHALIRQGEDLQFPATLARATDEVNRLQRLWPVHRIQKVLGGDLRGKTVCLWGLSFKPNTDDLREAPSVEVIRELTKAGAIVHAHDPVALDRAKQEFEEAVKSERLKLFDKPYAAAEGAEALVIMTEWQDFRTPNFKRLASKLKTPLIIDGRNIYDREVVEEYGFKYLSVGDGSTLWA